MMDGQTDLMQQVVERSAFNVASLLRLPSNDSPAQRAPRPHLGRDPTADLGEASSSRLAVRHVGRLAQQPIDLPAVLQIVTHLRGGQPEALHAHLDDLIGCGLPVEHIYLRLFQPAARHLGELWADDICSFVDVTLGMTLLQSGLRHLAPRFQRNGRAADGTRSILLTTLDDEQHTFGLSMTAEFFRRSGWSVQCVRAGDDAAMADRLDRAPRTVVGFSASRLDQLPALASAIRRIRRTGRDRIAGILVGGPVFLANPDCAHALDADAVGLDPRQALAEAEALVHPQGVVR